MVLSFSVNLSAAPSLEITEGVRHYNREKTIGPAKPLWFVSGNGFTMEKLIPTTRLRSMRVLLCFEGGCHL